MDRSRDLLSMTVLLLVFTACIETSGETAERGASADASAESSTDASVDAGGDDASRARREECAPLETRRPNATRQKPEREGQTRACAAVSNVAFDVVVVAKGLEHPWAVEPLAGGDLLVTERPGRMRIVTGEGAVGEPIDGVPRVVAREQGGLLDVALSPTFESDRTIFWSFSEPRERGL